MLVKIAFNPATVMSGAAKAVGNAALGGNLHDVSHLVTSESNAFGKGVQKMILSDAIIAAKKATEGKVFANRKPLPLALYAMEPLKALTIHESNLAVGALPKAVQGQLFDGNKLNVKKIKTALSYANKADRYAFAAQVGLPTIAGGKEYLHEREKGKSVGEAAKAGLKSGLTNAAVVAPLLALPRKVIFRPAAEAHKALSKDFDYGYRLLEDASKSAAKSLGRPKFLNYSHFAYATPEENLKGIGRIPADAFKKMMGQKTIKAYDPKEGYIYEGAKTQQEDSAATWGLKKIKKGIQKADKVLSGSL